MRNTNPAIMPYLTNGPFVLSGAFLVSDNIVIGLFFTFFSILALYLLGYFQPIKENNSVLIDIWIFITVSLILGIFRQMSLFSFEAIFLLFIAALIAFMVKTNKYFKVLYQHVVDADNPYFESGQKLKKLFEKTTTLNGEYTTDENGESISTNVSISKDEEGFTVKIQKKYTEELKSFSNNLESEEEVAMFLENNTPLKFHDLSTGV